MKLISKTTAVLIAVVICLSACKKADEPVYQTAAASQVLLAVSYGSDPKQKMDVYLPPNRSTNTSIIVFVHGGSFIGGDKSEFTAHAKYLASCGYAVLNVNYRLVDATGVFEEPVKHQQSSVKIKDQVSDISSAVDFAIANSKKWVVSSHRVAIAGHSAGGTLALLYSYGLQNTNKVQAVANIAGALDLVFTNIPNWQFYPNYLLEGGFRYTGYTVDLANEKYYKEVSPLYSANETKRIPTLNIFPQNNDVDGLPNQDLTTYAGFTNRLNELKVPNQFLFVAGADHVFSKPADWEKVLTATVAYFNVNIK
jgi:acetyl esterase/lipase